MKNNLSFQDKYEIFQKLKNKEKSQRQLAEDFATSKSKIQRIKAEFDRRMDSGPNDSQHPEASRSHDLDNQVFEMFQRLRSKNYPLNGPTLKRIALKIANKMQYSSFKASNGWLEKFKARHQLSFKVLSGELKSANYSAVTSFKKVFDDKMKKYASSDVYNCDETSLYYRSISKKSFVSIEDNCKGIKTKKDRVTLLLCCSMIGDKKQPFIIGKYKNPRCFKNVDIKKFNVKYVHSTNAWMNQILFKNWLAEFNQEMRLENRHILLIMDNAPSHAIEEFSNIEMFYLPKNTTSLLQPLDMGIIKAFKNYYQNSLIQRLIEIEKDSIDASINDVDMLETLFLCSNAWESVTIDTIKNCFEKAFNFSGHYITENSSMELSDNVINKEIESMAKDVFEDDVEDEDEEDLHDGIQLSNIFPIMNDMKNYVMKFNVENIWDFYQFKDNILKALVKKHALGSKITHYLNK